MAENTTPSKRQREESSQVEEDSNIEATKRHKSYNHILSLLESEEDEQNQDLSSIITTLQLELSSDSDSILDSLSCPKNTESNQDNPTSVTATITALGGYSSSSSSSSSCSSLLKEDEEEDKERVMRHLLEASDDELGIPNRQEVDVFGGVHVDNGDNQFVAFNGSREGLALCDGLWELEDVAANYYTMLQSELFM